MSDNIPTLPSPDVTAVPVATDEVSGAHWQRVKLGFGADGVVTNVEDVNGARWPVGGAQIGVLTETAPANDTASSGLNGRLQRIAQNISTLITNIAAGLGILSKVQSVVASVASGQTVQGTGSDIRGYQLTGIFIPSTFDGTVIRFQVSADNVTYVPLFDGTNTRVSLTVAVSQAYALWTELSGWSYIKVDCATAQATTATDFILQLNTLR